MPRIGAEQRDWMRERLLDAAESALVELGPAGASTREIVSRAGLSNGALYSYFAGKEELFGALADRLAGGDLPAAVESVGLSEQTAPGLIVEALVAAFGADNDSPQLSVRQLACSEPAVAAAMRRYDRAMVDALGAVNRAARSGGVLRRDVDPDALVEVIVTFFEGRKLRLAAGGYVSGDDEVLDTFLAVLLAGSCEHGRDAELLAEVRRRIGIPSNEEGET